MGFGSAQAANTSGTFNVNITLTSVCTLSAISALDFAYTSFQGGAAAATGGGFSVTCTNSLPYTFGLQSGIAAPTPPGAASIGPITDDAVLLDYSLSLSAAGGTGSGSSQAYSVTGTMASGQGGTCTPSCINAAATNKTHTLIVNY
jgi:spore coat protein U-like protein